MLLIAGTFVSCSSIPENADISHLQGKWILSELEGNSFTQNPAQKEAFIEFDTGTMQVSGNSSVNQFGGTFTVSEPGKISFSPMRSTMMAGLNMETENLLYKAFPRVTSFAVKGDVLSLLDASGAVLIKYTKAK